MRSTIELARHLGLRVVAEGIETSAALDLLRTLGCDIGQGYVISRPVAADELTASLLAANDGASSPALEVSSRAGASASKDPSSLRPAP